MRSLTLMLGLTLAVATASQAQNTTRPIPQPSRSPITPAASATPAPLPTTPAGLTVAIRQAETTQNSDSLLLSYGQAVTDPSLARAALTQLLTDFYLLRNQAQTAEQATQAIQEASLRFQVFQAAQNQLMIQQNQRMIELLERQAAAAAPAPAPGARRP